MTRATFETWVKPTSLMCMKMAGLPWPCPMLTRRKWLQNRLLSHC